MAVQLQTPYKEYTANGSTKSFALEFDCDNQDHLIVLVDDIEPVVGTWSLIGGAVVFGTAPTTGKKITIQRNTPFRRDEDFQSYDNSFRPPGVNKGFDKIWLKLQELGVADWILSNRIDALKAYVDRKDDELKGYLLEEISKQGVALDQLEDYYNYLMQRLAQIAVDQGWDASFVVDGDKNQHQINDEQALLNSDQARRNKGLESVSELLAISNPKDSDRIFVKSYHAGLNKGGGDFVYDSSKAELNNSGTILNGWVRLSEFITVEMFGAKGDKITDDTPAFQAAIDSFGPSGGVAHLLNDGKYLIDTNLNVDPNITISGSFSIVGSPKDNSSYPYDALSAIILNPLAGITLKGGSGLDGCLVYRKGLVFPSLDASAFSGTAIVFGGDDCFVINSMILGFNQAISSNGYQRPKIKTVHIDCNNGVLINNCYDVGYLNSVHCWPFVTVATNTPQSMHRSGSAFKFTGAGDWTKVTDCFCYAYYKGFHIIDCDDMVFTNCSVDGTSQLAGSIGFVFEGNSLRCRMIGCNISSQDIGIYISLSELGLYSIVGIYSTNITGSNAADIHVNSGDVDVINCFINSSPIGIYNVPSANRGMVSGCRFAQISTQPINFFSNNRNWLIGVNDYGDFSGAPVANINHAIPLIASASTLIIPNAGDIFEVTGSIGFNKILYGWTGRKITLVFGSSISLANSSGIDSLNIAGGVFNAVAGSTISLIHNGSNWFETSRKI